MNRLRVFFAMLVLLALPLQGFAAASQLFCGGDRGASQAVAHAAGPHHTHSGAAATGHSHHHADGTSAGTVHASSDAAGHSDSGHRCAVCASCCNLAAVASFSPIVVPGPAPQVHLPPVALRVPTRVSRLPDKPPRA